MFTRADTLINFNFLIYLVEPSGLEFMLNEEPVNPQANPAFAKLEGVAEGTFQLLYVE